MARFFLEVAYNGAAYSGFQIQSNANTVQAEVEKALAVYYRTGIELTGSSRTDAGVHARQNFFHFDADQSIKHDKNVLYHLNSILPDDIVVNGIYPVNEEAHCRFDAISREYHYYIYRKKNPFLRDRAYLYPYPVDLQRLKEAASVLREYTDFTSFSKRNTQVKNFNCDIKKADWFEKDDQLIFTIESNRFLRGMVKALVGTQLRIGRGKLSIVDFRKIIESLDCTKADFSVPSHGLFLERVNYDPEQMGLGHSE